jgi:hypothetical protein
LIISIFIFTNFIDLSNDLITYLPVLQSTLIGGIGGVLYCLRAVYKNKCVLKRWDKDWEIWYYIRPICSFIVGFVAFVTLKAGLLILDSGQGDSIYGYLIFSFVAGYNVDNMMKKIEDISENIWGIKRSNASKKEEERK